MQYLLDGAGGGCSTGACGEWGCEGEAASIRATRDDARAKGSFQRRPNLSQRQWRRACSGTSKAQGEDGGTTFGRRGGHAQRCRGGFAWGARRRGAPETGEAAAAGSSGAGAFEGGRGGHGGRRGGRWPRRGAPGAGEAGAAGPGAELAGRGREGRGRGGRSGVRQRDVERREREEIRLREVKNKKKHNFLE
jgi:hypothetical protein